MSVANYSTILTENNNSNIRVIANEMTFQNWGTRQLQQNATIDTNLAIASNLTVMTIRNGNIGMGVTIPSYKLDVNGDIRFTSNMFKGTNQVSLDWTALGATTYMPSGRSVGIGTTNTFGNALTVNGTVQTSNLVVLGQYFIANDNTTIRAALQPSPAKASFVVNTSSQSNFVISQEGIFEVYPNKTDVYLNGLKLAYSNVNVRDYDVTYVYENLTETRIFVTLAYPAVYNDIVDIVVWPSFVNSTFERRPGYVYQSNIINSPWNIVNGNPVYTGEGFVGIGTSSPIQHLHVSGSTYVTGQYLGNTNDTNAVPAYSWSNDTNTGMYNSGNNSISFATGGGQRMVINNTGVGIGTSTVRTALDVIGTTTLGNATTSGVVHMNGNDTTPCEIHMGNLSRATNSKWWGNGVNADSLIWFTLQDNKSWVDNFMSATRTGTNVTQMTFGSTTRNLIHFTNGSIITASNVSDVYATNTLPTAMGVTLRNTNVSTSSNVFVGMRFDVGSASALGAGGRTICDQRLIRKTQATSDGSMIWSGYNSAGTTYQDLLELNTNTGDLVIRGDVTMFSTFSDGRLKEGIRPIHHALDRIQELHPVEYTWRKDIPNVEKRGTPDVGLIAQDVKPYFPLVVTKVAIPGDDERDYMGIKYEKLVPYLISAIQDLHKEVRDLREEVQMLRSHM